MAKVALQYGVRNGNSPCFNCSERSLECHADCTKYKVWKGECEEIREGVVSKNKGAADRYRSESYRKLVRAHKHKHYTKFKFRK